MHAVAFVEDALGGAGTNNSAEENLNEFSSAHLSNLVRVYELHTFVPSLKEGTFHSMPVMRDIHKEIEMNKFFGMIATLAIVGIIPAIASANECVQLTIQRPDLMRAADPMFPAREATVTLSIFGASKEEVDACNKGNRQSSITDSRQKRINAWTQVRARHPFGQGVTIFLPANPNAAGTASRQVSVTAPTCFEQNGTIASAYFGRALSITPSISGQVIQLEDVSDQRFPGEVEKANAQCASSRSAQR